MQRNPAILLLGPTGSGKTPLGDLIQQRGLGGKAFWHFDFGANLRAVVDRNRPDRWVEAGDVEFLRGVLESGALLEDEQFPLIERIFQSFLSQRKAAADDGVVLNGMPRHVGQAEAVATLVDVRTVVCLDCSEETVVERIRSNVGGDRTDRVDDDLPAVANKLAIYAQRTMPLVEHYRLAGTRIQTVEVTAESTPDQVWQTLGGR